MDMPRSTGVFLIVGGLLVALMTQRTLLSGRQSMSAPGVIETPVEGNSGVREAPGLLEVDGRAYPITVYETFWPGVKDREDRNVWAALPPELRGRFRSGMPDSWVALQYQGKHYRVPPTETHVRPDGRPQVLMPLIRDWTAHGNPVCPKCKSRAAHRAGREVAER